MNTVGYAAKKADSKLIPFEFDRRELGPSDIALDIKFCGICHSDIHQEAEEVASALSNPEFPEEFEEVWGLNASGVEV